MIYAILTIIITIAGIIGTGFVIRDVNLKAKQNDIDTDLQRSHDYEVTVISNWGRLTKIYLWITVVLIAGTFIFLRFFV